MNKIKLKSLIQVTKYCPAQWEGLTVDDEYIYIRYRFGHLRAGTGKNEYEFHNRDNKKSIYNIFNQKVGEEFDGMMTTKKMMQYLKDNIDFPE